MSVDNPVATKFKVELYLAMSQNETDSFMSYLLDQPIHVNSMGLGLAGRALQVVKPQTKGLLEYP